MLDFLSLLFSSVLSDLGEFLDISLGQKQGSHLAICLWGRRLLAVVHADTTAGLWQPDPYDW